MKTARDLINTLAGTNEADGLDRVIGQAWKSSPEYKQAQAIDGQIEAIKAKEQTLRDEIKKLQDQRDGLEAKKGQIHNAFIQRHMRR
jgi:hypothetical protein